MSAARPYQILNKRSTVIGYWLFQSLGLLVVAVVVGEALIGSGGSLFCAIPALILSVIVIALQVLFVCDAKALGGEREISFVRHWTSYLAFGMCVMIAGAAPMWLLLILLLASGNGNGGLPVFALGCVGMIVMLVFGTGWMQAQALAGRRERAYRDAARALWIWSIACLGVCVLLAIVAVAAAPDPGVFQFVMLLTSPPIITAGLVALGCHPYLKELAVAREPWYLSHCHTCGYDLSGNLTVTHCSECGTPWDHASLPRDNP